MTPTVIIALACIWDEQSTDAIWFSLLLVANSPGTFPVSQSTSKGKQRSPVSGISFPTESTSVLKSDDGFPCAVLKDSDFYRGEMQCRSINNFLLLRAGFHVSKHHTIMGHGVPDRPGNFPHATFNRKWKEKICDLHCGKQENNNNHIICTGNHFAL